MSAHTKSPQMHASSPWRLIRWAVAAALLLVPLVAMQFTDEVNWDVADFAVFAALLTGLCLGFDFLLSRDRGLAYKLAAGVALMTAFLLVWISGAVGLIGSAHNDANLMYGGVLAIAASGAFIARWQAFGMAVAMLAASAAQANVGVIAIIWELGKDAPAWPQDIVVLTGIFSAMWLISAGLFWRASSTTRA
jgi:hypothetical protein